MSKRVIPHVLRGVVTAALTGLVIVGAAGGTSSRAAVAPANSSVPTMSGAARTGSVVTANPGTWTGSTPITFQYQWRVCGPNGDSCHDIAGATAQAFTIRSNDLGNTLRVHVIGSNSDGSSAATSNPSGLVAAGVTGPVNSSLPTISGSTTAGSTLAANPGTWTGANPIAFAYQWTICGADGNACHDIAGAAGQTYQLKPQDPGNTVRVRVTATNSQGATQATSGQSSQIAPAPTGCPALPAGAQAVAVTGVVSPAVLQVKQFQANPAVINRSTTSFIASFLITDTCGQPVQGAQVYATAVPFSQFSIPAVGTTDGTGTVTLQFNRLAGFPATAKQQLLVMFARASKPGESVLAGISTRRLVSFRVNLHG